MQKRLNPKIKKFLLTTFIACIFLLKQAYAICPVCTIAVGVGIGFSRWLGIDDTITGLWLGGLVVSLIIWTLFWFDKRNIRFKGRILMTTIAYYLIMVVPLYYMGIIGHPLNKLWGMDKIILGTMIGSVAFFLGSMSYFYLKKRNNNHAYFPFQKVVMPIAPLLVLSFIFYFITRS